MSLLEDSKGCASQHQQQIVGGHIHALFQQQIASAGLAFDLVERTQTPLLVALAQIGVE